MENSAYNPALYTNLDYGLGLHSIFMLKLQAELLFELNSRADSVEQLQRNANAHFIVE